MKRIHINASKSYDVLVGYNLFDNIGEQLFQVLKKTCKIAIISDSNVFPLYGEIVTRSLKAHNFEVKTYIFPAGEASKSAGTYLDILQFLAENHFSRSDTVLALGGGVVGDISGFVAATFLRGIRFIQVPTTLLAMVDSSVGGKTAIDLPAGKNLVGAFHQPDLVICDLNTLDTLPENILCDGCAEVIKYSVLYDEKLFAHLESNGLNFIREDVISRCIELKRDVVAADEFDNGERQKLNLGHTIGHGIEAQSNFTITHGQAVAIGMAIIAKSTCKAIYPQLITVLKKFKLPITTSYTAKQLFFSALSDKKRSGDTLNLIIPKRIGDCIIYPIPIESLESVIEEGL